MRLSTLVPLLAVAAAVALLAATPTAKADVPVVPYGSEYRYQVYEVGTTPLDWASPSFDDSFFPVGSAPFGSGSGFCPLQGTVRSFWPTPSELLLRRTFTLPAGASGVKIIFGVDNDAKVAVNGVQLTPDWLIHEGCPTLGDFEITVPDSVVVEGTNLLAVLGRERHSEAFLDLQVTRSGPTAVAVRSLAASRSRDGIFIRWRTASEAQIVGFNLYREQRGKLVKLNRALIPSVFGGTAISQTYSWLDRNAPRQRSGLRYRLQAVSLNGNRSWVGAAAVSG
jgi:hypothetical protein